MNTPTHTHTHFHTHAHTHTLILTHEFWTLQKTTLMPIGAETGHKHKRKMFKRGEFDDNTSFRRLILMFHGCFAFSMRKINHL